MKERRTVELRSSAPPQRAALSAARATPAVVARRCSAGSAPRGGTSPLPWLTGEDAEDAALWREHLENRTRMGKAFEETDTPDWPWSSWTRFQGVALTSLTFGAWALSGASCAFALVLGSWRVRVAIAAYFCVTTV